MISESFRHALYFKLRNLKVWSRIDLLVSSSQYTQKLLKYVVSRYFLQSIGLFEKKE